MKENKKELLDKISKQSKKGNKFESLVLNLALQKLDSENFEMEDKAVYTADGKRLIYILGDETNVKIREGVEVIGEMAVAKKKNMKALTLPASLKKIEREAFMDCDALVSVTIPASVEEIDAYAFEDCDSLKSVYFEKMPKELNRKAFAECERLHEISVPEEGVRAIRKALHYTDGDTDFIVVGRTADGQKTEPKSSRTPEKPKVEKKEKVIKEVAKTKDIKENKKVDKRK
ncbi:MAG: leucine-rich repeat domain-containing protein [Prevotella sp.]|nr:leucine-rich repeat domain-containing protein [Prevotella sp.]